MSACASRRSLRKDLGRQKNRCRLGFKTIKPRKKARLIGHGAKGQQPATGHVQLNALNLFGRQKPPPTAHGVAAARGDPLRGEPKLANERCRGPVIAQGQSRLQRERLPPQRAKLVKR